MVDFILERGQALFGIIIIVILAKLAIRLGRAALERIFSGRNVVFQKTSEGRLKTLSELAKNILTYVVYFVSLIMILEQIGINTGSLIAAAGLGGLAIGFGAQHLVRDIVTGFFILLEDHYDVGDYVTVSGISGLVEQIGIRVTRVRDFGGELHIIPNGAIQQVTNHMGTAMRVLVSVDIAHEVDVNYATNILEELFAELANELEELVEGPNLLGVQDLGDSGVKLLVFAQAKTMFQWAMAREIRKRIKLTFDEKGIEIPYPRRYVIFDKDVEKQTT